VFFGMTEGIASLCLLKTFKKVWRTIVQDHFKRLKERLAAWKETERNVGWIKY